jgi:hypothetical protein
MLSALVNYTQRSLTKPFSSLPFASSAPPREVFSSLLTVHCSLFTVTCPLITPLSVLSVQPQG